MGFTATAGNFYAVYGILLAATLGIAAVFTAVGFAAGAGILKAGNGASIFGAGLLVLIIGVYAVYFLLFAAFVVLIQNRIWNHTTVGDVSFRSQARVLPMARIYFVNILLLIVTLGLFTPFAVIRSLKYRLESGTATYVTGMEQFLSGAPRAMSPQPAKRGRPLRLRHCCDAVDARYFDGRSSRAYQVQLLVDKAISTSSAMASARVPLTELRVSEPLSHAPRIVTSATGFLRDHRQRAFSTLWPPPAIGLIGRRLAEPMAWCCRRMIS